MLTERSGPEHGTRAPHRTATGSRTSTDEEATGLSSAQATQLLEEVGPNEIPEERGSLLLEIGSHFWGPIPWMIEAAVVLTAVVRHWADFAIIAVLLVVNGAVGFWEEHQAGNAIAALKERLAPMARVRRDGRWQTLAARLLVPGDLVHVELGQIVPADARVISGACEVDQSALTGESLPLDKKTGDELYSGSVLTRGEASALVTDTGVRTLFGRSAQLAGTEPPPSHFQRAVLQIGRELILLALVLVAAIVAVSLARGAGVSATLEFALVVTIASVPVALPAVLYVTMAIRAGTLELCDGRVPALRPGAQALRGARARPGWDGVRGGKGGATGDRRTCSRKRGADGPDGCGARGTRVSLARGRP
ncbi:MAG TPA: HAD-IC family P-type ATPase [Gaiellaceae bacterium]|nr:HAD-IC family P-type ATPase [Gaiellaceae bacterium]